MRELILIKHSASQVVPDIPASRWRLSAEGRRRCEGLAAQLAPRDPACLYASPEPKAAETAAIVARRLGKAWQAVEGLHEQDRRTPEYLGDEAFREAIRQLFERPDELVLGQETANEAYRRFSQAVMMAVATCHEGNVAIFAHGTVISLFVSRVAGAEPFALWKELGLPAFVVLSLPDLRLVEITEGVGG